MSDPDSGSIWWDPSLHISIAALLISGIQAIRSIRNDARNNRRVDFIEFIAGEFAKVDVAFDALEAKLRRASNQNTIDGKDILDAAYSEKKARQTQRRKYLLGQYKVKCGCADCGWRGHPAALDFDHINPEDKAFHIAQSIAGRSVKGIFEEVRKCRVLCANCHRIHTYNEAQGKRKYD